MTDHLSPSAKAALQLSDDERIERIRSPRWIEYTIARQILNKMDDLLTYPKTHRMPNLLIVGDTNNGKTKIVNRFYNLHHAHENPDGDAVILPVLVVQAPPTPDESRFYNSILEKLLTPYKPNDRPDKKLFQIVRILDRLKLKLLVIDEIHNVLAGTSTKQRLFLTTIKNLGNEAQISIVAAGIKDAFNVLQSDPQLSNRFEPVLLPRWELGDEYDRLLAGFESALPLRNPSNLIDDKISIKLSSMSEGLIGEISAILTRASTKAIQGGVECINSKILDSIDWIPPSDRKWPKK
jgi:hypothetical protein